MLNPFHVLQHLLPEIAVSITDEMFGSIITVRCYSTVERMSLKIQQHLFNYIIIHQLRFLNCHFRQTYRTWYGRLCWQSKVDVCYYCPQWRRINLTYCEIRTIRRRADLGAGNWGISSKNFLKHLGVKWSRWGHVRKFGAIMSNFCDNFMLGGRPRLVWFVR